MKLKEIVQGLRYRKGFKSLSFIVAPMLARIVKKGYLPEKFTKKYFWSAITGSNYNKLPGVRVEVP